MYPNTVNYLWLQQYAPNTYRAPFRGGGRMIIYTVHAYRWGGRENHSYPVGVYQTEKDALTAAVETEQHRGGKYECEVYKWDIRNTDRSHYLHMAHKTIKQLKNDLRFH